jgi:anthranilate synthase component 2/para-aminobenzoate synthetase component 2
VSGAKQQFEHVRMLLIDNYDSFTYNLVQAFRAFGAEVLVYRNDAISIEEARQLDATHLVISPGPGRPEDAGVSLAMIAAFERSLPILGVCLGHQSLVQHFGGDIVRAPRLMHGKTSLVTHDGKTLYKGLSQPFEAGRYHSISAVRDSLPAVLELSAETEQGEIMGVRHRSLPLEGVQFHPESVLNPEGNQLLANFLLLASETRAAKLGSLAPASS